MHDELLLKLNASAMAATPTNSPHTSAHSSAFAHPASREGDLEHDCRKSNVHEILTMVIKSKGQTLTKFASIFAAAILLSACAPGPRAIAYNDYVTANHPRAEQGLMPWPEYYEGMYARAVVAKLPLTQLNQIIEMIDVAWRYEKREITQEEFMRARRQAEQARGN